MFTHLSIRNYILIDELDMDFHPGLTIITGETGAGKSILLGAMGLLSGQRADSSTPGDPARKCIVEGTFDITALHLKPLFEELELEYDEQTIIRREIMPDGRSRAFVNDSPVNLQVLKQLGSLLIDIHSQQQQLYLARPAFQMHVLDHFARQQQAVDQYREDFRSYRRDLADYTAACEAAARNREELDYLTFQFGQLAEAHLQEDEQEELEQEQQRLLHTEDIKQALNEVCGLLDTDGQGALSLLKSAMNAAGRIRTVFPNAGDYADRIDQAYIDMKDVCREAERENEMIDFSQERLDAVEERLNMLYQLEQKHHVSSVKELIALRDSLRKQLEAINGSGDELDRRRKELDNRHEILLKAARKLSEARKKAVPDIEKAVTGMLRQLNMPNGNFRISVTDAADLDDTGKDVVRFLFSANKQQVPEEIGKVASGGEMSRLMLSLKAVIAGRMALPTLIFDEIDSGVSGETADRMGSIMGQMSQASQVICITHLPQVAAKGTRHCLVYKQDEGNVTRTRIRTLSGEERVRAIAGMLSGETVTEAALANARFLLGDTLS